jgi:hypothetical protein
MKFRASEVGKTLIHLTLDLWVAVLCTIVWSVGLCLTLGLAITVLGGALALVGTLGIAMSIGRMERARSAAFLGTHIPQPPLHPANSVPPKYGILGRYIYSRTAWNALSYVVLKSISGVVFFALAVSMWSAGFALVAIPFFRNLMPDNLHGSGSFR